MRVFSILTAFVVFKQEWCAYADLHSAINDLIKLLDTYKGTIEQYSDYIKHEEKRLRRLKREFKLFQNESYRISTEDKGNYLSNPINAFRIIKKLYIDLKHIEQEIDENSRYVKENIIAKNPELTYPTYEDLSGAARAMSRVQEAYRLTAAEAAEGKIKGVKYSNPLSSSDCFELGRALFHLKDYKIAIAWMTESLRKYSSTSHDTLLFNRIDIYEVIAISYYNLGIHERAKKWIFNVLKIDTRLSSHMDEEGKPVMFNDDHQMWQEELILRHQRRRSEDLDWKNVVQTVDVDPLSKKEKDRFYALCRGEFELPKQMTKRLKCRYQAEKHPFLKLAPLKEEQLYVKPDIFLYYEVIHDSEIKELMKLQLHRGKIFANDKYSNYRISKISWMEDKENIISKKINLRVRDMTGLDPTTGEDLQIANYGIGGSYGLHLDVSTMSNVAQGGATIFQALGLTVPPVKNAALYWFDLHPSGEIDYATYHAACPVLMGSKWVSNKWIHLQGQEYTRPCNLEYEEPAETLKHIPAAIRKTTT